MSQPYVGEIRIFAGNFAPSGWMLCQGQLLAISENETLFQLIGTTYGGDGQSTFALPDLQGRVPMHAGQGPGISQNYILGEKGGVESVTLTIGQIPAHAHNVLAAGTQGDTGHCSNNMLGDGAGGLTQYHAGPEPATMLATALQNVGGSQPHDNFQPYLVVNFIISLFGVFPSPT